MDNVKDFNDLREEDFQRSVAIASFDGKTVAVTPSGLVTDKKYAEILRAISEDVELICDLPMNFLGNNEFMNAAFDIIQTKIEYISWQTKNSFEFVKNAKRYIKEVNKFLENKEKQTKTTLPRLSVPIIEQLDERIEYSK